MKLTVPGIILCAGIAFAAPPPSHLEARSNFALERRAITRRANKRLGSDNWSGALVHEKGVEYNQVVAEITIPEPKFPNGFNKSATYQASIWVGFGGYNFAIDGYSSTKPGILQTGFYYLYDTLGSHGVYAFYEWYPDGVLWYDEQGVDPKLEIGDKIRITATATSATKGTVLFENLTKKISSSQDLTAPKDGDIDISIAEWIVESMNVNLPDDVDFGTMPWENMSARKTTGKTTDLTNAYFLEAFKDSLADPKTYSMKTEIKLPNSMTVKWLT